MVRRWLACSHLPAALSALPAAHARWAVNAAKPFNRVPMWSRIVQIAECLPGVSEALFGEHLARFAKAAEGQRHGHAHALRVEDDANSAAVLHYSAKALAWLLRAAILVDLGFTPEVAEQRILRHEGFRSMHVSAER